jgi:SCP-2 sterol transfer family
MATTTKTATEAAAAREGDFRPAPGLVGLSGRLRVEVVGKGAVVLEVKDGHARFVPPDGDAAATVIVDSEETVRALQCGRLNPVVAALQGRLELKGDLDFAIRTILGLQVAQPFADAKVG